MAGRKGGGDAAREFFAALWGEEEEIEGGARIVRWCLPSKATAFNATAAEAAADAIETTRTGAEVYTGVSAMRSGVTRGRGELADVAAVAGLMIDLDVVGPGRRKPDLFASTEECLTFLGKLPLGPTLVVHSGNGLQAWWLFREPELTATADERARLSGVSRGWSEFVRATARAEGRNVDATWDLTRVARVPGTFNRKYGEPREVRVVSREPLRRYAVADFDDFAAPPQTVGTVTEVRVKLDADASPPIEKMDVLREVDKKFALSWERRRPDLADQSPSGYDMSLASLAVRAGWTDQEVANLLIAHRRRHGSDLKLRDGYYAGVIGKARDGVVVSELEAEIASVGVTPDEEGRAKVLTVFSNRTGARLTRVVQYLPEGKDFAFHFADGKEFTIGLKALTRYHDMWLELCAKGFAPNPDAPKAKDWLALVNNLVAVAEKVNLRGAGPTAKIAALIIELARYYNVLDGPDTDTERRARAIMDNGAFRWKGQLWVRRDGILRLARERRDPLTPGQVAHAVTALGGESRLHNATVSAARASADQPRQKGGYCYVLDPERVQAEADLMTWPEEGPPCAVGGPQGDERAESGG